MKVKTVKAIVHPDEVIAKVGETFTVTNHYHTYGNDWYDMSNEHKKLNIRADVFTEYFKEV